MTVRLFYRIAAFALALVLAPAQRRGSDTGSMTIRQGKIEQITPTTIATSHHAGVGAVLSEHQGQCECCNAVEKPYCN